MKRKSKLDKNFSGVKNPDEENSGRIDPKIFRRKDKPFPIRKPHQKSFLSYI